MFLSRITCLLALTIGCTAEGELGGAEPVGGKADEFGQVNPAPEIVEELVNLLRAEGALKMPPRGRQFGAHQMHAVVDVVEVPDQDLRPIVHEHVCDIGRSYGEDSCDPTFPLFAHPDVHALYQSGFRERAIRTYFLRSLVSAEHRDPIEEIVNRFAWTFVRLTIHDLGSSIFGDELIILHACCSDQPAVVVRISYHAG